MAAERRRGADFFVLRYRGASITHLRIRRKSVIREAALLEKYLEFFDQPKLYQTRSQWTQMEGSEPNVRYSSIYDFA